MNSRAVVLSGVAAVCTIAFTATVSRSNAVRLPLPQAASAQKLPFNGQSTGTGARTGTGGVTPPTTATTTTASGQQTYTTAPPVTLTACSVSVSDPHPLQSHTAETVTVFTAPGAEVRMQASYLHATSVHGGEVGTGGSIAFPLPIDHAPVGVTVSISVSAKLRGVLRVCQSSFTPVVVAG